MTELGNFFDINHFIGRAFIAGLGVAIVSGLLGCFVVWRRMAYFGESLAHSSLLGIALGWLIGININLSVIIVCALFALTLISLERMQILATDTLLGILAHSALSLGMVAISLLETRVLDISTFLFGDILTVTKVDLAWIYGGGLLICGMLWRYWSSLTLMTMHEDLARAESVNTLWLNLLLMGLMTIAVAISLRIVGILLITSMLIIPTATARLFARSPESMATLAVILGSIAVILGLLGSLYLDTPSGPSIVTAATMIFALLLPFSQKR